jgi:hypothetical protein
MNTSTIACFVCVACFPLCFACGGRDGDLESEASDAAVDSAVGSSTESCATLSWGTSEVPASTNDCESLPLGRWMLCGDDAGVPDADNSLGFAPFVPEGSGIEFAAESGALTVYILVPDGSGGLVRSQDPARRATAVQPGIVGSACSFWMAPDSTPGDQTGWTLQRYRGPNALLINGSASYVPAPSAP